MAAGSSGPELEHGDHRLGPGAFECGYRREFRVQTEELRSVVLIAVYQRVDRDVVSPPVIRNTASGMANAVLDVHGQVCSFPECKGCKVSGRADHVVGEHDGGARLCGCCVGDPLQGVYLSKAR